jgi:putative SOS response-associated peptidase YedK
VCGRYTLTIQVDELFDELDLEGELPDAEQFPPRYNIAPTQLVPAVVDRAPQTLSLLRWGLVPHWAKDPSVGSRMINARSETVASKPAFRTAFRKRRCLIPADGFYEWRKAAQAGKRSAKVPMYIHAGDGRPFTFAGLWEVWRNEVGEPLHSCTIVTTAAVGEIRELHDRMPVILPPSARGLWLSQDASVEALQGLLVPRLPEPLEIYEVSPLVGSPRNDGPVCVERVRRLF